MTDKKLQSEAAAFFDAFVEAFCAFDGQVIAERYKIPLDILSDGAMRQKLINFEKEVGKELIGQE